MKTRDVLAYSEQDLSPLLKVMKLKELERHAEKILKKQGQLSYKSVLAAVIKAVPSLNDGKSEGFIKIQAVVQGFLPVVSNDDPTEKTVVPRLAVILMVIITKKLEKIQKEGVSG